MFTALLYKAYLDRFEALQHNNPPGTQKVVSSVGVVKPSLGEIKAYITYRIHRDVADQKEADRLIELITRHIEDENTI